MSKHLIPKPEFSALLEDAKKSDAAKEKLWFEISGRILRDWNGVSYKFLDTLTPGQSAVVACAEFHRGAAYDFLTSICESEIPARTLRACELIGAAEYVDLLRQLESVFPGRKFPEYAEDMLVALRKQPDGYFDKAADKIVTGKTMRQPLRDYIFAYITAHPEDFSTAS